jgi:hypothetical protein
MAFQGSLKELPLPDIIQLVSVSGKTGRFSLSNGASEGEIHLQGGKITHAEIGKLTGEEAVYEMAVWAEGEFLFVPGEASPTASITKSNTNLLMEAARRIDEWKILSKKISSTRLVPVFTNRATTSSVSLTPQEWRVISKIDERRSIEELAVAIGQSPFETCKLLYGLLTSELIRLEENFRGIPTDKLAALGPEDLLGLSSRLFEAASRYLQDPKFSGDLEEIRQLVVAEVESGRAVDAVLDQIRALEKLVSSAHGPHRAKEFLGIVAAILQ